MRQLGIGVAAFGLIRCGSCTGDPPAPGRASGDASIEESDASGGTGGGFEASSGGTTADAQEGGSAGSPSSDAGLTPEQAWLVNPDAWQAVPGTEFTQPTCQLYEAKADKIGFSKLTWQPCGDGCASASVGEGYGSKGARPVASTHDLAGGATAFVTYDVWVNAPDVWHYVRRVVRLEDGLTVGALNGRHTPNPAWETCSFNNGRESARANFVSGGEPGSEMWALAPLSGGQWVFSQPPKLSSAVPPGLVQFDIDTSGGAVLKTGKGGVWGLLDPKVNQWTPLEAPSTSHLGAGQGDLAVWTDHAGSSPPRVRGWAPDGKGARTLFDPAPPGTCLLNVSPEMIVSLAIDGGECKQLPYPTKGRFWWAPRKYEVSGPPVTSSPDLPVPAPIVALGPHPLRTWGNYVAAILARVTDAGVLDTSDPFFLIMNVSTGKLWQLDPPSGHRIQGDAWTITPSHFYYGDREATDDSMIFRRMFRLDLAKLDEMAKALN